MKKLSQTFLVMALCLGFAVASHAQDPPSGVPADTTIPRNSRIYIEPMEGFETYLAAALRKKEVPVVMVTQPDLADFIISGTHETKKAGWAKTIFMGDNRSSASASMQVVNVRTHVVVYADSSDRGSANRGERSTAEKLAKYLKKKIEDDEKKAAKMSKQ
ncbi:MAG TPA: hypothetical protein VGO43_15310 [Pyrinomonadaceae bacterium]|jgi:hypothetical protein|nr:hypothetical protein [Pyrinomonadaceae bacterium]